MVVRHLLEPRLASAWATRVIEAEPWLVDDFGGEQRSLGRALYTHLENGRAHRYFQAAGHTSERFSKPAGANPSLVRGGDDVVEAVLPGMQALTRAALARLVGGVVRQRHGFCGSGVHVFPAGEKVAMRVGVFHDDLEGLTGVHVDAGARALSFVIMLQAGARRGGLTLFAKPYRVENWQMEKEPRSQRTTTTATARDAILLSSYRRHRIHAFSELNARKSVTCHAVEVDHKMWDCWF